MTEEDSSPRHVWWLDPGKKTGLAMLDRWSWMFTGVELDFKSTCIKLMEAPHVENGLLIGAEAFIITPQTGKNTQAPWSLELIGCARMVSQLWLGHDIPLTAAASAKRFSSDDRLRSMGWYQPGKGHANDAARHLLLALATRGWLSQETLESLALTG